MNCKTCQYGGIDATLREQRFPELEVVEGLKWGSLVRCSRCGGHWFLDERWLHPVPPARLEALRYWQEHALTLSGPVLETLAGIGGVLDGDTVVIPCQVGVQLDAAVRVGRTPPLGAFTGWGSDLVDVRPSPRALPLEVRRACLAAKEKSMGFAPVGVVDGAGAEFTLGHRDCLFYERGPELRLSGRRSGWRGITHAGTAQAVYYADWFPRCVELLTGATAG